MARKGTQKEEEREKSKKNNFDWIGWSRSITHQDFDGQGKDAQP